MRGTRSPALARLGIFVHGSLSKRRIFLELGRVASRALTIGYWRAPPKNQDPPN